MLVTALVSALGLKEVWGIIKKKMDLDGKKAELKSERKVTYEATKDQITAQVIEELKNKIGELETKIDSLIAENIQLREKLARMEERILVNAKNKVGRRKNLLKIKKNNMDNFDAHKWFKKEYLGEGHTEDKTERDQFIRRYDQLSNDDKLKLAKIQAMMDRERSLKEEDIEENRLYPDYDDIIELIKVKTMKNGGSEIDEAMDVMEFIGQHYGINFEFGRGF